MLLLTNFGNESKQNAAMNVRSLHHLF